MTVYILMRYFRAACDCGEQVVGSDIVGVFDALRQAKCAAVATVPLLVPCQWGEVPSEDQLPSWVAIPVLENAAAERGRPVKCHEDVESGHHVECQHVYHWEVIEDLVATDPPMSNWGGKWAPRLRTSELNN